MVFVLYCVPTGLDAYAVFAVSKMGSQWAAVNVEGETR